MTDEEHFEELSFYTLAHGDPEFLHQYAVDAYAAQHATERSKPIYLVFALAGLYLHREHGFSGRAVQQAHMRLAARRKSWPQLPLPAQRGTITVGDVVAAEPGTARDAAIRDWAADVWDAFGELRGPVAALLQQELGIGNGLGNG